MRSRAWRRRSQYTILRTGGLGPGRALWLLASLALVFGAFTFVVGDYVSPFSERIASQLRAGFSGSLKLGTLGRLDQGALDTGPTASAAIRSTSARPSAAPCCTACASSSSMPTAAC